MKVIELFPWISIWFGEESAHLLMIVRWHQMCSAYSRLGRLKVLEVQVLDRLKRAVKWIDRLKLHAKIDRLKLLSKPSSRLDRLKRWKLKLDRLKLLEVQGENFFITFQHFQNLEHPLRICCTHFWFTLRDSPELAMECQNSFELGASLKLGASLEQKLEQNLIQIENV